MHLKNGYDAGMILNHNYTKLVRANDVEIPDIYFNRLKTGIKSIDLMFGDGILPGSTFTVDASPGTGKSTLLLQLCQYYAAQNHEVAFLSGEENIYMVAMRARRLNSGDVAIAMENRLSNILNIIANNDLVIIDSYPSIVYDLDDAEDKSRTDREEQKLIKIIEAANYHKCAVGIILHVTKSGTFKGSTLVQHAVDVNISIKRDEEQPDVRIIDFTKNRLGCAASHNFYFGEMGYDFEKPVQASEDEEDDAESTSKRSNVRLNQMQMIMEMKEPPHITVQRVCSTLNIDAQRASYLLWLLVKEGKLEKYGRGNDAVWKFSLQVQNIVA